jgi:hypothetical protein
MSISVPRLSKPGGHCRRPSLRLGDTIKLTFAPKVLRSSGTNRHGGATRGPKPGSRSAGGRWVYSNFVGSKSLLTTKPVRPLSAALPTARVRRRRGGLPAVRAVRGGGFRRLFRTFFSRNSPARNLLLGLTSCYQKAASSVAQGCASCPPLGESLDSLLLCSADAPKSVFKYEKRADKIPLWFASWCRWSRLARSVFHVRG